MKLEAKEDKIKPKGLWRANPKFSHLATENPPHSAALIKFQGAQGRETGTKWAGRTPPQMLDQPDVNSKEKGNSGTGEVRA